MNIAAIQYSLPTMSLEIYVAGCRPPHCPGCHNQDLWDFNNGAKLDDWDTTLRRYAAEYSTEIGLIKNVWILGGEPLDQTWADLINLLVMVNSRTGLFRGSKTWLFTHYEIHGVPDSILKLCDFVKTGRYEAWIDPKDVCVNGTTITLGSGNQDIYATTQGGHTKIEAVEKCNEKNKGPEDN